MVKPEVVELNVKVVVGVVKVNMYVMGPSRVVKLSWVEL
jgi:hypothetical protein